jgi:hypothetical protein
LCKHFSLQKHVSGKEIIFRQSSQKSLILLSRLFLNTFFSLWSSDEIPVAFETLLAWTSVALSASQFGLHTIADLSLSSIDAMDDLPSSHSRRVLTGVLPLDSAYSCLLRHVGFELIRWEGVSAFANCFAVFTLTESIRDGAVPKLDSRVVSSFPPLFDEFRGKRFGLLWRGSRDGFRAATGTRTH